MAKSELKSRFFTLFSNLPINIRKEVILVVDIGGQKQPITWNAAFIEIKNDTDLGERILDGLDNLSII